jgi:hypothetical protein
MAQTLALPTVEPHSEEDQAVNPEAEDLATIEPLPEVSSTSALFSSLPA